MLIETSVSKEAQIAAVIGNIFLTVLSLFIAVSEQELLSHSHPCIDNLVTLLYVDPLFIAQNLQLLTNEVAVL